MRNASLWSAPTWRQGVSFLALLVFALPLFTGCSEDGRSTNATQTLSPIGAETSLSLAPDFCPSLPSGDIYVIHSSPGPSTFFNAWMYGIPDGYDLYDGNWDGWCLEPNGAPPVRGGYVTAHCSYDTELPGNYSDLPVNEINYLLNTATGDYMDIQIAIWILTWGSSPNHPATEAATAMADDALANGGDFVPGPGDLVAVFLYTGDGGIGLNEFQDTMIQWRIPGDDDGELGGCTPGYWKTHFGDWPEGYSPSDDFDTTFGVDLFDPDITLGEAAWARGGQENRLARHGTAALLNAAHGGFEYAYSMGEVLALVQAGDADALEAANEDFECPLEGTSADPKVARGGKKDK